MTARVVWRIASPRHARTAFTGDGARLYGGRWNPKGVPMVYTAESRALAMVEMLVQDDPLAARYVVIPAILPEGLRIEQVDPRKLPADWRSPRRLEFTRAIGAAWAASRRTVVLAVPSAVVPGDTNYMLNPRHPEFRRVRTGKPSLLVTDVRLIKNRGRSGGDPV